MPVYNYRCNANGRLVEVQHDADASIRNWGELCFVAQLDPGDTPPGTPVQRVILQAPSAVVGTFNSELRNMGFTKLVRRDEGVYENVTATHDESRYMERGKPETIPRVDKKIED